MIRPPVIRRLPSLALLIAAAATIQFDRDVHACTNIVVSRDASSDGSVFVTYSIDGPGMTKLHFIPAGKEPSEENSTIPSKLSGTARDTTSSVSSTNTNWRLAKPPRGVGKN